LGTRTRVRDTLNLSGFPETRTRWGGLCECFLNQLVVYQTQCSGEERGFPRSHSLDVLHKQLGVFLGEVVVEELNFHVHDRFVAGGPSVKKRTNKTGRCSPCSEGGEEFLRDVGGGEFGSDVPQCILLDVPDPKLSTCQHRTIYPYGTPTAVAKEYIERGEQARCCCTPALSTRSLSHVKVRRGTKVISFV